VSKFEVKGKDKLVTGEETFSIPLEDIKSYIGEGCLDCQDYTAELAEISVGPVGGDELWSTVFVRPAQGEEIVKAAAEKVYIELKQWEEKGLGALRKLAKSKKESRMQRSK